MEQPPHNEPETELNKEFYSIGEVARILGVEAYTIRYWQKEFNLKIPTKSNGRRIFTPEVIEVLQKIKRLRYQDKLQIDGVKHQLKQEEGSAVVGTQTLPEIHYPEPDSPKDAHEPVQPDPPRDDPPRRTPARPPEEPDREHLLNEKRQIREQKYVVEELKRIKKILDD